MLIMTIPLESIENSTGKFSRIIPQPDFISNDWDGDTIPNDLDPDDIDDSTPFGDYQ